MTIPVEDDGVRQNLSVRLAGAELTGLDQLAGLAGACPP
jgi:hypothetical protein